MGEYQGLNRAEKADLRLVVEAAERRDRRHEKREKEIPVSRRCPFCSRKVMETGRWVVTETKPVSCRSCHAAQAAPDVENMSDKSIFWRTRMALGIGQEVMASLCRTSRRQYCRIESGVSTPSDAFKRAFKGTVDHLSHWQSTT